MVPAQPCKHWRAPESRRGKTELRQVTIYYARFAGFFSSLCPYLLLAGSFLEVILRAAVEWHDRPTIWTTLQSMAPVPDLRYT